MYKSVINSLNEVLTKKISSFELLLNVSFVLIIGLIIFIFYWHNINWKVAKLNRCKINLNSEGSIYNLYASYDQTKLYKVRYDNSTKHNASIDCACPSGNIPNTFNIPAYNTETRETEIIKKYCICDKYYDTTEKNKIHYNGDNFLVDFYSTKYDNQLGIMKSEFKNTSPDFPSA
jgi:hypothetical protein